MNNRKVITVHVYDRQAHNVALTTVCTSLLYKFHERVSGALCEYVMMHCAAVKRLRSHMRCHGEKTFARDLCMKKFTMRAQLVRHQLVHSGVKAFVCPYCAYRSAIVENLRKHCHAVHKVLYPPKKRDVARNDDLTVDSVSTPDHTIVQGCSTSASCITSTLEGCTTTTLTLLPVTAVLTVSGPDVGDS